MQSSIYVTLFVMRVIVHVSAQRWKLRVSSETKRLKRALSRGKAVHAHTHTYMYTHTRTYPNHILKGYFCS